jgi:hypothetical protein
MKKEFTYFDGKNKELCDIIGVSEEYAWKKMSLDDWDYALIFNGKPKKEIFDKFLVGCFENEWIYFSKQNKTVGMAYHS